MRLADVFAKVLKAPADDFTDESSQESVLNWTSLRHVALLIEVENTYQIHFSNTEMAAMRTVGDVRTALARKGAEVS